MKAKFNCAESENLGEHLPAAMQQPHALAGVGGEPAAERPPQCVRCGKRVAAMSCKDCKMILCKPCATQSHADRGSKKHVVQSLEVSTGGGFPAHLCALHDWEKLTLYSHRARAFGCVKCFQEGALKGHQGQSLQRAFVEMRETLQRNQGALQKQSTELNTVRCAVEEGKSLVADGSEKLQGDLSSSSGEMRSAAEARRDALLSEVESWKEARIRTTDDALGPLKAEAAELDEQAQALQKVLSLESGDEEEVLEACSGLHFGDAARPAGGVREAVSMSCEKLVFDCGVAQRVCSALNFVNVGEGVAGDERMWGSGGAEAAAGGGVGGGGGVSDAMELDRVSIVARGGNGGVLTEDDRRLFWKHRVTLTDSKKALPKLLQCMQWESEKAVRQLLELIPKWVPLDVDDALSLLGETYMVAPISDLAVRSISVVPNEELAFYLMPLTIALRYDSPEEPHLLNFLISRAVSCAHIAVELFWYLTTEKSVGGTHVRLYTDALARLQAELAKEKTEFEGGWTVGEAIKRQESFVVALHGLMGEAKKYQNRETRPRQIERLRSALEEGGTYAHLASLQTPVNLPHHPFVEVSGIIPGSSTILKSGFNPIKLVFRTGKRQGGAGGGGHTHTVLMKNSNDLRRDQMILGCIGLMDHLLQREGVDLKITTYKVTATSADTGLVQWVEECMPLSQVLAEYDNDIRNYFRRTAPPPSPEGGASPAMGEMGVGAEVMDNYVKSCAGFCVISFILGLGDRHLDNLMVSTNGRLFHVDFEYILGNDPKPFAPPMKICEQMVMAMGGRGSKHFVDFQRYCCKAYLILRKSSGLFVAMFDLVKDLNISHRPGMSNGSWIEERFRPDLTREQAVLHMHKVIEESMGAIFPQVVDAVHRLRLFFKT